MVVQNFIVLNKSTGVAWTIPSDSEAYRRCAEKPNEYEISPVLAAKPEPKKPEKSG